MLYSIYEPVRSLAQRNDGSQPPVVFDLSLSESAGSRSLDRLVRPSPAFLTLARAGSVARGRRASPFSSSLEKQASAAPTAPIQSQWPDVASSV